MLTRWFLHTILAPPFCASCKSFLDERTIFCATCSARITPIVSGDLSVGRYSLKVFAISDYQEPLKSLIIAKSWSDIIAAQQLAELMWTHTYFRYQPCDFLIPVPLHWTRALYRGYNQAEVIAQRLVQFSILRQAQDERKVLNAVQRIKKTPFQSALKVIDRPANVKAAFVATADAQKITGKHVMIIDDLMTTGATLKSVAQVLIPFKPASISALVACRVVR